MIENVQAQLSPSHVQHVLNVATNERKGVGVMAVEVRLETLHCSENAMHPELEQQTANSIARPQLKVSLLGS